MCLSAVVLASTLGIAAQQPRPVGSLVGCLSETVLHQRVPYATVVAKGSGVQETAVTGLDGCYELKDLPPAAYRVTARLGGFDNVTRDRVLISPSTATRLDLTTRQSPFCECVFEAGSALAEQWDYADAVLHVRLMDVEPEASMPQGYYRHRARVLDVLRPLSGRRPTSVFILQNQASGTPDPYDLGQELVAFLKSSGPDTFRITNDEPGLARRGGQIPSSVFLVQDGLIQRQPPDMVGHIGKPIDTFLAELRTLSRRK